MSNRESTQIGLLLSFDKTFVKIHNSPTSKLVFQKNIKNLQTFNNENTFKLLPVKASLKEPSVNDITTKKTQKTVTQTYDYDTWFDPFDSFYDDPFICDNARRVSNRFEATQVTASRDPTKWTPCSQEKLRPWQKTERRIKDEGEL